MSNYNPNQATRVFSVTPAPSGQNTSKEIWEGFLTPEIDAIDIVNERTNKLIGTIGGTVSYKFDKLPKSYVAQAPANSDILGDYVDAGFPIPINPPPFIRLENGNIANIDYNYAHTKDGIFIFDAYELNSTDPIDGWWIAYKVNDDDPTLLDKVAELRMTFKYWDNGAQYSYNKVGENNTAYFVNFSTFFVDNTSLFSDVTKLTVNKSGNTYTLSATETSFNYDGATVLSLYNDFAPIPVAPGVADWSYRSPYYSLQNDYYGLMNGVDEGWVFYGNSNTPTTLFTYQMGFNLLTGETAFVEPISSLAATTNFNPAGVVDATYFNDRTWESHPAGVLYYVYNSQGLDNGNNTNSVTALFSPRWTNNKLVTFLNSRDAGGVNFLNTAGGIFNPIAPSNNRSGFDSENFYQTYRSSAFGFAFVQVFHRFKLDSVVKEQEIQILPLQSDSGDYSSWDNNDAFIYSPENLPFIGNTYCRYSYMYWQSSSPKAYQLQSNNSYPYTIIGNKFYSNYGGLTRNSLQLGIEYDVYNVVQ